MNSNFLCRESKKFEIHCGRSTKMSVLHLPVNATTNGNFITVTSIQLLNRLKQLNTSKQINEIWEPRWYSGIVERQIECWYSQSYEVVRWADHSPHQTIWNSGKFLREGHIHTKDSSASSFLAHFPLGKEAIVRTLSVCPSQLLVFRD